MLKLIRQCFERRAEKKAVRQIEKIFDDSRIITYRSEFGRLWESSYNSPLNTLRDPTNDNLEEWPLS